MNLRQINWKRDLLMMGGLFFTTAAATAPAFTKYTGISTPPTFEGLLIGTVIGGAALVIMDLLNVGGY